MGETGGSDCCSVEVTMMLCLRIFHYCCLLYSYCYYRAFNNPNPPERAVLDAISSLTTQIKLSLKLGTVRRCSFSVCFRRDVFNYLFKDSGSCVSRKRGKFYNRNDFVNKYFSDSSFVFYNDCNEGVRVVFPVYLYSYVKCIKLDSNCETVSVILVKERC